MTTATKWSRPAWRRLRFLLTPEDSSQVVDIGRPSWASPWCCRTKTLLWLVVGVVVAILVGQL